MNKWIYYPNPVEDKVIKFCLKNSTGKNSYRIQLVNQVGQSFYSGNTQIADGNGIQSIKLERTVSAGNYDLILTSSNGEKWTAQVLIK